MKRLIFGLLGFVVVEVLIIIVVTAFMTFADLKEATTGEAIVEALLVFVQHPIIQLKALMNPLFIFLTGANALYMIWLQFTSKAKKTGWRVHEANAYHGSARWGKPREIVDDNHFLQAEREVQQAFFASLKEAKDNGGHDTRALSKQGIDSGEQR